MRNQSSSKVNRITKRQQMVLGLITLCATAPLIATSTIQLQDSASSQQSEAEESWRTSKCHLDVRATKRMSDGRRKLLDSRSVVLWDGKLYLVKNEQRQASGAHPLTGYFLPYPNKPYNGLVTTVNDENMLNWVYVDSQTSEVRYAVRAEAEQHLTGPMDMTIDSSGEKRLTFEKWEGFVAVEEPDGEWALYFDRADNGLKDQVAGRRVTEVELIRVEAEQDSKALEIRQTDNKDPVLA